MKVVKLLPSSLMVMFAIGLTATAQEKPPAPAAPRPVKVPSVIEKKLPNGLGVVVIERKGTPLVAARLMIDVGVSAERLASAGLADMTAELLTKGTKTRNATQIAEDLEFLGADLSTNAGLDTTAISVSVTSDKLTQAMAIMADVALRPTFPNSEIDLLRTQKIDALTADLAQPGFLASYVASVYAFGGNPSGGTPESLKAMSREQVINFYRDFYAPDRATLFLVGDVSAASAFRLAAANFGSWRSKSVPAAAADSGIALANEGADGKIGAVIRILVIDLPNSGQAAVSFVKNLPTVGHVKAGEDGGKGHNEINEAYFPGLVANSILGGGYSSRLNQEIRIKRGLSYGASSLIAWRRFGSRFTAQTQTKNGSAAEVAELIADEVDRLGQDKASGTELNARRAALIGDIGLRMETNADLLDLVAGLYSHGLDIEELEQYHRDVEAIDAAQAAEFAAEHLTGGTLIIAGDYSTFRNDLEKRFPVVPITVVEAAKLDLSRPTLQK